MARKQKKKEKKVAAELETKSVNEAVNIFPPILMKLCRLCEAKDGPFLNIFGSEQGIAKKIDFLLPFVVSEYDELPHKICFRCSAKIEELNDFVQRSIKTQENLYQALGKKDGLVTKNKPRKLWEDKLNKSNMSNEDICDAVIKKAMEGIKDLPIDPKLLEEPQPKRKTREKIPETPLLNHIEAPLDANNTVSQVEPNTSRPKRSINTAPEQVVEIPTKTYKRKDRVSDQNSKSKGALVTKGSIKSLPDAIESKTAFPLPTKTENASGSSDDKSSDDDDDDDDDKATTKSPAPIAIPVETVPKKPPFNIMDHVSAIKVNGVGVLFQCKLCNRNFLQKDVVMSHGCAKTGVPKIGMVQSVVSHHPPKDPMSSVKFINNKPAEPPQAPSPIVAPPKPVEVPSKPAEAPRKPKVGPASKTKKLQRSEPPLQQMKVTSEPDKPLPALPILGSIEVPSIPGMKNRYKLVPGPNNSFTLVEDSTQGAAPEPVAPPLTVTPVQRPGPASVKRKAMQVEDTSAPQTKRKKDKKKHSNETKTKAPEEQQDVIDLDDEPLDGGQPYPVGFFQTVTPNEPPKLEPVSAPVTFTTPAMKKQSYTIVQTGNPSKLLISTKPQPEPEQPKQKKSRKSKHELKQEHEQVKQPFTVTLEEANRVKDDRLFTFINVDPLLQPSYVLPTDNIIQESQISTSSAIVAGSSKPKDSKYDCSMCPEKFTREKKLLTHLQQHYNKMDEADGIKERSSRKRSRRS